MPRPALIVSIAGVALGVAWTLSPLTLVLGAATLWMCAACVTRLDGRERVHVTRILTIGVGARFLIVGLFLLATRPDQEPYLALFPDARYLLDRSLWIRNIWLGVTIGPHQWLGIVDPYAASSYPYVLALLQMAAGPAPFALCLLSVTFFTAGALLIHRLIRDAFGGPSATLALGAILFWPTLFAWSVSVLRESFQFFLGTIVAAALFYVFRKKGTGVFSAAGVFSGFSARAAWAAALVAALAMLSTLRAGTAEIAILAIALAVAFRLVAARATIAIALVVIAAVGFWTFEERITASVRLAADRHVGHVMSAGRSFRLLDEKFYAGGTASLPLMTSADSVQYLARSAGAFLAMPLPWRAESASEMALVPQQLAWYAVLAAALVGIAAGVRRDAWLTAILLAYPLAGLMIIGPNSGNIGTLVRHRDMIAPFVLSLAAAGVVAAFYRGARSPELGRQFTTGRGRLQPAQGPPRGGHGLRASLERSAGA